MSAPSLPRALVLLLSVLAVALLSTCGGNDSTSPSPAPPSGPTFNFTFTMSGTSHTRVFSEVGTWNYRCVNHGGMNGVVNVSASSPTDSAVVQVGSGNALVFNPANVTIKQNGSVRWVNVSNLNNHTATR